MGIIKMWQYASLESFIVSISLPVFLLTVKTIQILHEYNNVTALDFDCDDDVDVVSDFVRM